MRRIRILAIIIFLAALVLEIGTRVDEKRKEDPTMPAIDSSLDQLSLSVKDMKDESSLMKNLVARDWKDGDLTDKIMVESKSYFVEKGVSNITYVVFDSNSNCTEYTRPVVFTDYVSPEFDITQPLVYLKGSSAHFLDYVTATDCLDGDLTDKVKIVKSSIDNGESGVYPVKLQVMNSYGDMAEVEVNVWIRESNSMQTIHLSDYLVYLDKGDDFDMSKYVTSIVDVYGHSFDVVKSDRDGSTVAVDDSGDRVCEINVNGEVDTDTPGCYQLAYTYHTDQSEGTAYQTVVVRE